MFIKIKKYKCSICKEPGHNKNYCKYKNSTNDEIVEYIVHRYNIRNDIDYRLKYGSIDLIDNFKLYDVIIKNIIKLNQEITYSKYTVYKLTKKTCKDKLSNEQYLKSVKIHLSSIENSNEMIKHKRKYLMRYRNRILSDYYFIVKEILLNYNDINIFIETYDEKLNFWLNLRYFKKQFPMELSREIISYLI